MVVSMDHLVGQSILKVALVPHLICADLYAIVRIKSAGPSFCAPPAVYVMTGYVPAELLNVVLKESDYRTSCRMSAHATKSCC